jgi:hypothetical protein
MGPFEGIRGPDPGNPAQTIESRHSIEPDVLSGAPAFELSSIEIRGVLPGLRRYDLNHEFPDVLNYEDFELRPDLLEGMMASRGRFDLGGLRPVKIGKIRTFPYPKFSHVPGEAAVREMADIGIVERVVLRGVAARIGAELDATLSPRMFAYRLVEFGPQWKLRHYGESHTAFRDGQIDSLVDNWWPYTLFTDIASFYPSVDLEILERELRYRCPSPNAAVAITALLGMLRQWHDRDQLAGLPIGEEAAGIFANAILAPLHEVLHRVAADHYGYSDDLVLFGSSVKSGRHAREAYDDRLAELGLTSHPIKTHEVENPLDAAREIQNFAISYIEDSAGWMDDLLQERVRERWYERTGDAIDEPYKVTEVKYLLTKMRAIGDRHAVQGLLKRWDVMELLPKETTKYLGDVALNDPDVVDAMLRAAGHPVTPTNEGLVLHALKFLGRAPRDDRLLGVCNGVLASKKAAEPTKAWAAYAMRRAPSWSWMQTIERAESGQKYLVGRAMLASTRGITELPVARRRILESIARDRVDMAATCEWALRAA